MEIKTKFDIGQTVWFVDYKEVVHNDGPVCRNKIKESVPVGVSHGKITGFYVGSGDGQWYINELNNPEHYITEERYTISPNINAMSVCRNAEHIYSTQYEAEQALRIAEHKYHIDKMDELLAVKALLDELTERAVENGIIPKQEKEEEQVFFQEETQCPHCGENFHYIYVKGEPYQVVCPKCGKLVKAVSIIKFR